MLGIGTFTQQYLFVYVFQYVLTFHTLSSIILEKYTQRMLVSSI